MSGLGRAPCFSNMFHVHTCHGRAHDGRMRREPPTAHPLIRSSTCIHISTLPLFSRCALQVTESMQAELREAGLECLTHEGLENGLEHYSFENVCPIAKELYSRLDACGFDVQYETVTQMLGKMVELAPSFGAINDTFVEVAPSLKDASSSARELLLDSYACQFYACVHDTTVEDLLWAEEDDPYYAKFTSLSRPFTKSSAT